MNKKPPFRAAAIVQGAVNCSPVAEISDAGKLEGMAWRKNRPWLLVAIGFILVSAAWKTKLGAPRPEPNTIAYHYEQWLHHKENLVPGVQTNGPSIKKAIWYLDGKPSFSDRMEKIRKHEDILVRSGFLEYRDFELEGVNLRQFLPAFNQRAKQAGLVSGRYSPYSLRGAAGQQRTMVHFTARKEDMAVIESIIKNIESASTNL